MGVRGVAIGAAAAAAAVWLLGTAAALGQQPAGFAAALAQARQEYAAKQYGTARGLFERANKLSHNQSADCYVGEAEAELRMGQYKDAAKAAERALPCAVTASSKADAENVLGVAQMQRAAHENQTKYLQRSIASLQQALAEAPGLASAHFNLGVALLRDQQTPGGETELRKFLAMAPEDAAAPLAERYLAHPASAQPGYWPEFTMVAANGQTYTPDALAGKVVMLDFWGSWCPPCRESVGTLQEIWKRYAKKDFVLVSVDVGDSQKTWASYTAKHKMTWPQYWDGKGAAMQRTFGVHYFPTFIVAGSDGVMRLRFSGEGPEGGEALEAAIAKLLRQAPAPH